MSWTSHLQIPRWIPVLILVLTAFSIGAPLAEIHEVTVANFAFTPQDITITDGDTVRWIWVGGIHTATSGADCVADGLFSGSLNSTNPVYEFTFNGQLGDIPYFCIPHCALDMVGMVTVQSSTTAVEEGGVEDPEVFQLLVKATPNPLHSSTTLHFTLAGPTEIQLAIYDAGGRLVTKLMEGHYGSGAHAVPWTGREASGGALPTGVYYARLNAGDQEDVRPLMLIR